MLPGGNFTSKILIGLINRMEKMKSPILTDYDIETMVKSKHLKAGTKNFALIEQEIRDMKELRDEKNKTTIKITHDAQPRNGSF